MTGLTALSDRGRSQAACADRLSLFYRLVPMGHTLLFAVDAGVDWEFAPDEFSVHRHHYLRRSRRRLAPFALMEFAAIESTTARRPMTGARESPTQQGLALGHYRDCYLAAGGRLRSLRRART
jgi:hypothetical protein